MKAIVILCAVLCMVLVKALPQYDVAPTLLTDTEELVNTQYPIKESVNTQQFPIKESVNTQQYPIKESVNTQYTIEELVEKTTDGVIAQEAPTLKESPEEAKAQVSVPFSAESQNSNTRLKVTFINNRSTPIKTYWVNYNHNAVHYYTLAPNAQYTQYTFGTHPWIVTDENDNALHFLIPYLTDVQITIQESASW